jgi:long-subunit fatty acid transport protein
MKNKIGEFITGPKFLALATKAIALAVAEADAKGLPKAYNEQALASDSSNLVSKLPAVEKNED